MRTVQFTIIVCAVCLSCAYADPWRTDPVMEVKVTPVPVKDIAVSPTGHQIAWVTENGLSVHKLKRDGRIGDLVRHIDLSEVCRVAFGAGGKQIICAANWKVHLINRETWDIRTVDIPLGRNPAEIVVIEQRPEAYICYGWDPHLVVINLRNATLVAEAEVVGDDNFSYVDVVVSPEGDYAVVVAADFEAARDGNPAMKSVDYVLPQSGTMNSESVKLASKMPYAACLGPDLEHVLVVVGDDGGRPLRMLELRSNNTSVVADYGFASPMDVARSHDGRFIVVVDRCPDALQVISGADMRDRIASDTVHDAAGVRTHTVPLSDNPLGVALHPVLDVAYVRAGWVGKIWAVRLGLPGV